MSAVKVVSKNAERIRKKLLQLNILDPRFKIISEKNSVYFPITDRKKALKFGKILMKKFTLNKEKEDVNVISIGHDRIGDIALIEKKNVDNIKETAESLLKQRGIGAVYIKVGPHRGKFRRKHVKYIAGRRHTTTIHCENNVRFRVDIREIYFTPRLSTERARIASMVREGERVLVMFSGCAPYVCVIARNSKASKVTGVEINRKAHEFGLENLRLNRIKNAELYHGDVRKVVPELGKFDRIVMPLPMTGGNYLDTALTAAKKGTTFHFYDFAGEKDIPKSTYRKLRGFFRGKARIKLIGCVRCGQIAPRRFRVCADFEITDIRKT